MKSSKKIIISKSRYEDLSTHLLLDDYLLVCPEEEKEHYAKKVDAGRIVCYGPEVQGLGETRNFVLDHFNEDLVMLDDDIKYFISLMNLSPIKYKDASSIEQILDTAYNNSLEVGAKCWGINQNPDVRKYHHNEPFKMSTMIVGIVGCNLDNLRFTTQNKSKVDIDFTLQNLMEHRIVWVDQRFGISVGRDNNKGGCSLYRTNEAKQREMSFLKNKWGQYISIGSYKDKEKINIRVPRKSSIKF